MTPSVSVPGRMKWPPSLGWGSPPCSAGGGSLQAEEMALIAEKEASVTWPTASATRNANGSC